MFLAGSMKLKIFTLSLVALALLFLSRQTYSQEKVWVFIGTDEKETMATYVDPNTRKLSNGNLFVWEKILRSDTNYAIALVEWDCGRKRSRTAQQTLYNKFGEPLNTLKNFDWVYTIDETLGAGVYKMVCRNVQNSTQPPPTVAPPVISLAEIIVVAASLRESPSINGSVIREVPKKERLILSDEPPQGNWHRVIDRDSQSGGWLHQSTFKVIKPKKSPPRRKLR